MDHIEKVMSNAYALFTNITNGIKKKIVGLKMP